MRGLIVVLALLLMAPALNAQSFDVPVVGPVSVSAYSNSTFDSNGNLLIFDVSYSYVSPIPPPSTDSTRPIYTPMPKTRVTVITADGRTKKSFDFDGSFQVVGVGRRAVYATVTTTIATATPAPAGPAIATTGTSAVAVASVGVRLSIIQKLVALNVVADTLPSELPSIPVSGEVKIASVGSEGSPDNIATIEPQIGISLNPPAGLLNGLLNRTGAHSVRLYSCDGASFKEITMAAISVR